MTADDQPEKAAIAMSTITRARVRSATSITRSRRNAVREHRKPRRRQRRGHPAQHEHERDRLRPSVRLRVHQQRHDVAPLAGDRADVRELNLAQLGVVEDRAKRLPRLVETVSQPLHEGRIARSLVLLKQGREDFGRDHPSRVRGQAVIERAKGERLVGQGEHGHQGGRARPASRTTRATARTSRVTSFT